ncbi:hypothetical protein PT2222_100323 [Paraburkholderia tropica]
MQKKAHLEGRKKIARKSIEHAWVIIARQVKHYLPQCLLLRVAGRRAGHIGHRQCLIRVVIPRISQ